MLMSYYKYIPLDRLSYFEDELLRFTQPKDLNDPFECLPKTPNPTEKELNELIEGICNSMNLPSSFKDETLRSYDLNWLSNLYKQQTEKVSKDLGIFSLTQNWKNALMWSHYGDSHRGVCIGFDKEHNFFKDYVSENKAYLKFTKKVEYSLLRTEIALELGKKPLTYDAYLTKSLDWKYEEEIRVISSLDLCDKIIKKEPYSIHLFKVPHLAISEIILGANIILESEEIIKKFASINKIKIFKARISDEKFDMDRDSIVLV